MNTPRIKVICEKLTGTLYSMPSYTVVPLNVIRVERTGPNEFTAISDHWPPTVTTSDEYQDVLGAFHGIRLEMQMLRGHMSEEALAAADAEIAKWKADGCPVACA